MEQNTKTFAKYMVGYKKREASSSLLGYPCQWIEASTGKTSISVKNIEQDSENHVFRMQDFIKLDCGTIVNIIFYIDENFDFVGLIYNDLTEEYTSITIKEDENDIAAYERFKKEMKEYLENVVSVRRARFDEINNKMLSLINK